VLVTDIRLETHNSVGSSLGYHEKQMSIVNDEFDAGLMD
jgi:hypothetical protein